MCIYIYIWVLLISFVEVIFEHPDPIRTAVVGPLGPLWAPLGPCGLPWAFVAPLGTYGPGPCRPPCALVGQALAGPLGSCGLLWAGPLRAPPGPL